MGNGFTAFFFPFSGVFWLWDSGGGRNGVLYKFFPTGFGFVYIFIFLFSSAIIKLEYLSPQTPQTNSTAWESVRMGFFGILEHKGIFGNKQQKQIIVRCLEVLI